jgi:hypothetical protein
MKVPAALVLISCLSLCASATAAASLNSQLADLGVIIGALNLRVQAF